MEEGGDGGEDVSAAEDLLAWRKESASKPSDDEGAGKTEDKVVSEAGAKEKVLVQIDSARDPSSCSARDTFARAAQLPQTPPSVRGSDCPARAFQRSDKDIPAKQAHLAP